MQRRIFIGSTLTGLAAAYLTACQQINGQRRLPNEHNSFVSVLGTTPVAQMGFTLTHEHILADLRDYSEQKHHPPALNLNAVVEVIMPHLLEIKKLGVRTIVDCTAPGLGRNPQLLKMLAAASGLNIITTTGAYLSAELKFKPDYFDALSADDLAAKWINEARTGIDNTGVKPGMIKIAVSGGNLTADEKKLINAAKTAQKVTGLVIGCHIGPWQEVKPGFNGTSAVQQMDLLIGGQALPNRWIWEHAQNEADYSYHKKLFQKGAWLSYDGYRIEQTEHYVQLVKRVKSDGFLNKLVLSQDAGWYNATEPKGGSFNSFAPIITHLIPALINAGLTADDIQQLFVRNPQSAFASNV
jgi:phosphotriesterase-related protein